MAVYDDRLEITSPGGLLPGVTIEKMREGYSKIRNKALAHAFLYMNMIEEWGSGIPKLMREMQEYGLREPEFIDMEIGFRVNLYRGEKEPTVTENNLKTSINRNNDQEISINTNTEINHTSTENHTTGTKTSTKASNTSTETNKGSDYSDTEKRLINLIKGNPSITMSEMASNSGLSRSGVQYALNQLRIKGIITREGSPKKGRWVVIHG